MASIANEGSLKMVGFDARQSQTPFVPLFPFREGRFVSIQSRLSSSDLHRVYPPEASLDRARGST